MVRERLGNGAIMRSILPSRKPRSLIIPCYMDHQQLWGISKMTTHDWSKQLAVNDWKDYCSTTKDNTTEGKALTKPLVECKQKGRQSLLFPELTEEQKLYVFKLRGLSGTVNTAIVQASATGLLLQACSSADASCLSKTWAKY